MPDSPFVTLLDTFPKSYTDTTIIYNDNNRNNCQILNGSYRGENTNLKKFITLLHKQGEISESYGNGVKVVCRILFRIVSLDVNVYRF